MKRGLLFQRTAVILPHICSHDFGMLPFCAHFLTLTELKTEFQWERSP